VGISPVFDETVQTPLPMHIVLPRPGYHVRVRNTEDVPSIGAGPNLLLSYGLGMPMVIVAPGELVSVFRGPGVTELVLAGESGSIGGMECSFCVEGTIGLNA
jgi:hypothetical protein